ncbi:COMM domain-containing protein 7 isoform X1 [Hippocampus comes]|uniref:COMM domain containing 7 n=1 Tax=Hippocampus comes TaxID=109280 RepID=A0A3Q2XFN5_HIPCM|nr:PREDICTED: COMM domain-containing protein 7 isoform X1 [Hippocampus comes]
MQLHCTNDALPHSVSGDFHTLNKFNEQQFLRLVEILFQFLLEPKETEKLMQQLSDFASEHRMSTGPLKNLMKSVILVPQGAMKRNLTAEQLKEDLQTLGLHEDKAVHFSQQWAEHRATLSRLATRQTLTVNRLVDMEWKFGVTVGTSEIQKMSNIFLQLKLVVQKGNTTENLYMELTLPQFYNFLHEMERAKASMDSFS